MLPPGSVIGILGGGQLGRMLAMAAADLGMHCHIFTPEDNPPAAQVADVHTRANFDDITALKSFAKSVDVITYEFENIPVDPLREIENFRPIRPSLKSLEITQDRLIEKNFVKELKYLTAPFESVNDATNLYVALSKTGLPAVIKTRRLGYDGKGQSALYRRRRYRKSYNFFSVFNIFDAFEFSDTFITTPSIVEKFMKLSQEFTVILARRENGDIQYFDIIATYHERGILRRAKCSAKLHPTLESYAIDAAVKIAKTLKHVGVLTVEFFLIGGKTTDDCNPEKRIYVNEIAPRVHNSGHLTRESCITDQFEQHIRAICGWQLGKTTRIADAEMVNLLGDEVGNWKKHATKPDTHVTLYGKGEARPGRKMGHVVRVSPLSR